MCTTRIPFMSLLRKGLGSVRSLKNHSAWVFDCDGVLWLGSQVIPRAVDLVQYLVETKRSVFFITNNASLSRVAYAKKFHSLGFTNVTPEMIISSAYCAAWWLKQENFTGNALLLGTTGLRDEVYEMNPEMTIYGIDDPEIPERFDANVFGAIPSSDSFKARRISAVIQGLDPLGSVSKLAYATIALRHPPEGITSTLHLATNGDFTFPAPSGGAAPVYLPGNGSFVTALRAATGTLGAGTGEDPTDGVAPVRFECVGKPSPTAWRILSLSHGIAPADVVFVGDRLDTDIAFAGAAGAESICVLTGVTSAAAAAACVTDTAAGKYAPTYVSDGVGEILDVLRSLDTAADATV